MFKSISNTIINKSTNVVNTTGEFLACSLSRIQNIKKSRTMNTSADEVDKDQITFKDFLNKFEGETHLNKKELNRIYNKIYTSSNDLNALKALIELKNNSFESIKNLTKTEKFSAVIICNHYEAFFNIFYDNCSLKIIPIKIKGEHEDHIGLIKENFYTESDFQKEKIRITVQIIDFLFNKLEKINNSLSTKEDISEEIKELKNELPHIEDLINSIIFYDNDTTDLFSNTEKNIKKNFETIFIDLKNVLNKNIITHLNIFSDKLTDVMIQYFKNNLNKLTFKLQFADSPIFINATILEKEINDIQNYMNECNALKTADKEPIEKLINRTISILKKFKKSD